MRISEVLKRKGASVTTLQGSATVRELVAVLTGQGIGSVVVLSLSGSPVGIVGERDVVTRLAAEDASLLDQPIENIMGEIVACTSADTVDSVLQTMTDQRMRHLPVLEDGQLVGLVSIGDLVKSRIDDLSHERDQMSAYISGSRA